MTLGIEPEVEDRPVETGGVVLDRPDVVAEVRAAFEEYERALVGPTSRC